MPCPAPRVAYADGDMPGGSGGRRRSRRKTIVEDLPKPQQLADNNSEDIGEIMSAKRMKRECPIPKPPGLVGEILGFKRSAPESSSDGKGGRPP